MIVLDTSALSLAWRRRGERSDVAASIRALVERDDVDLALPGIALQELLQGTRTPEQAVRLAQLACSLTVLLADRELHIEAARIASACSRNGIAVSAVDALIAAHVIRERGELLTLDRDFKHIAKHTGLRLYDG